MMMMCNELMTNTTVIVLGLSWRDDDDDDDDDGGGDNNSKLIILTLGIFTTGGTKKIKIK